MDITIHFSKRGKDHTAAAYYGAQFLVSATCGRKSAAERMARQDAERVLRQSPIVSRVNAHA